MNVNRISEAIERFQSILSPSCAQDVVASGNFDLLRNLAQSTLQAGVEPKAFQCTQTMEMLPSFDGRLCEEPLALQAAARLVSIVNLLTKCIDAKR